MQQENIRHRILCLWLPNWPIQRLVAAQSELKKQNVVLFRKDSRRGQLVAAASPLAQKNGVQVEMPLSEAKTLLSRISKKTAPVSAGHSLNRSRPPFSRTDHGTPLYHVLQHDPTLDLYEIEKLADELDSFSPLVGLQQETQFPNCIFLDVTGLASLFGGEFELAKGVHQFCEQRGYLANIAVANTVAEAQGAAQFQCEMQTPRLKIVQNEEAFHTLPVSALRLSDWITTTLYQLGVRTIGQLLALPRKDLSARFGKEIHHRIDQMNGTAAEPLIARKPVPEYYAEQLLEHPTGHQPTIEVILERLIENICQQLSAAQQGALQWTIRLFCQDHKLPLKLFVSLFHPTATAEHIVQLARMQLEQLLHSMSSAKQKAARKFSRSRSPQPNIPFEVNEITVSVTSCVLVTHRQRNLFDENPRLDKQSLAHLINRLSGRLGRENVVYPILVSGAQPEHAFQMKPLVNPYSRGPRKIFNTKTLHKHSHVMARPLKIFRPAIRLESVSLKDRSTSEKKSPPALLRFPEHRHKVINHWGPERIETGWWRGRTVRRDYWRVETETHQQFWIYYDLRKQAWFLQGEF